MTQQGVKDPSMKTTVKERTSKSIELEQIVEVVQADLQQGICKVMLYMREKEIIVNQPVSAVHYNQGLGTYTGLDSFRNELLSMNNTWLNMAPSASAANFD